MTIITKPLSGEKKQDKLVIPLVSDDNKFPSAPFSEDPESQNPETQILKKVRRVSAPTILFLTAISALVFFIGIFGGKLLYDQYIGAEMRRFKACAQIPIQSPETAEGLYMSKNSPRSDDSSVFKIFSRDFDISAEEKQDNFDDIIHNYFKEEFELDLEHDEYEKIDVPDFRDGRSGRFIHDFNANITGIIDLTGNRCFVMPLDRGHVLPPKSLFDLIHKMWDGYYKVDTEVVRETMRVVTPALTDLKGVGTYIAKECENKPVYKLERYVGGVVKRSADLHVEAKFAQFSGNKITEFDIINLEDVKQFEEENKIH